MHKKLNIITLLFSGCLFMTVLLLVGCGKEEISFQSENEYTSESGTTISDTKDINSAGTETAGIESVGTETVKTGSNGAESDATDPLQAGTLEGNDNSPTLATIYVQVNGAVKYPGVYKMQADARVFEAVECAGGMTDEAATEAVNQAEGLTDGQMITIYTREEWQDLQTELKAGNEAVDQTTSEEKDDRVNINTADIEMLCSIPGVGQVRAESIISYRQEQGEFKSIEEVKNVPGIKDGLFKKIKNKIKI